MKQVDDDERTVPGKRATLKTIADLTGLSLSTVSLSLRGGKPLKEETRRRVMEVAAEVGYVPDRAGVRLRTGKTNVISLILHDGGHSVEFTSRLLQGVAKSLKGTRYHLTVSPEFEDVDSVDAVRYILENNTADGVILTHTIPRDKRIKMMMDAGLPFVSLGRTAFETPHPFHDFDTETFMDLAVARLDELGCRSLILAQESSNTTNYRNIVNAFRKACSQRGIDAAIRGENLASSGGFDEVRHFGRQLAADGNRPDGIICSGELYAIALCSGLQERGVLIGRDMKLVCKQTSDILPIVFPHSDGIEEDMVATGVELTRLLLARLDDAPVEELQTLGAPVPRWRYGVAAS